MSNIDRVLEKADEIHRLAELGKGRSHDDHEVRRPLMRQIQREVDRLKEAATADPEPSPPPAPAGRVARMLKHGATHGGYPHTSFALAGWRRSRRMAFLEERAAAGDTAVIFYVRALNWPGVFHGTAGWPQPTFDLYTNPDRMHRLLDDIEEFEMRPLPCLMDNTEWGPWQNHHPRLVRGLQAWGDRLGEVCIGIEANLFFGQWPEPGKGPELFISDALLNTDPDKPRGLKIMFPRMDWGWHGQGWLPVRGADVYWHQWDWESHRQQQAEFVGNLWRAKTLAESLGQRFFAAEAAQHIQAREHDADRLREWTLAEVQDVGW